MVTQKTESKVADNEGLRRQSAAVEPGRDGLAAGSEVIDPDGGIDPGGFLPQTGKVLRPVDTLLIGCLGTARGYAFSLSVSI